MRTSPSLGREKDPDRLDVRTVSRMNDRVSLAAVQVCGVLLCLACFYSQVKRLEVNI